MNASRTAVKRSENHEETLPSTQDAAGFILPVKAFAKAGGSAFIRRNMDLLRPTPPQTLILEGGTAAGRLAASKYWGALLNCPQAWPDKPPCLTCPTCIQMISGQHRDSFFLDGSAGSIKIDAVREIRPVLSEAPRSARWRLITLYEGQALLEASANALLKSLEDPSPGSRFLLSCPQRERLLPTIVSRAMVLTLPWPLPGEDPGPPALEDLSRALCQFLRHGTGLFQLSGTRSAIKHDLAEALLNRLRSALIFCLRGRGEAAKRPEEPLERFLSCLPPNRLRIADEILAECQESLHYGVNAALTVEWLATRLYLLLPR